MTTENFFSESKEQSIVKATIVTKYFHAWAKVIIGAQKRRATYAPTENRIAYIDLFSGPGRYEDGTISTPLRILEKTIQDEDLRQRLVAVFNDKDTNNTQSLEAEIKALPGIDTLNYSPQVHNNTVGEDIVAMFEQMRLVPTLFFVDPWGYKGLSLRLINAILKNWGCDCIFFFNYNRINMGLNNEAVREHMNALFGETRADALRARLYPISPEEREMAVVEELTEALKEMGGKYVLPFCFKNERGTRTNHHLIFVSKDPLGYKIMKEIMAGESSNADQGVPSLAYCPADRKFPLLFEMSRPLDDLRDMLINTFTGQSLTMRDIYERHNVGTPYVDKNYKAVLMSLEDEGKIITKPPKGDKKRRKGTFADTVVVTFPPLGDH